MNRIEMYKRMYIFLELAAAHMNCIRIYIHIHIHITHESYRNIYIRIYMCIRILAHEYNIYIYIYVCARAVCV